jgi:hypothetical protein
VTKDTPESLMGARTVEGETFGLTVVLQQAAHGDVQADPI